MRIRRARLITWIFAAAGVATLFIAGFAWKDVLVKHWYLHKLASVSGEESWTLAASFENRGWGAKLAAEDWYIDKLRSEDPGEWKAAAERLAEMDLDRALPAIMNYLDSDRVLEVESAVRTLAMERTSEAVPALVTCLRHKDPDVRAMAALTLRDLGPEARLAVPHLVRVLRDDWVVARHRAAQALGAIGPDASQALPALREVLERSRIPAVRRAAGDALASIQGR